MTPSLVFFFFFEKKKKKKIGSAGSGGSTGSAVCNPQFSNTLFRLIFTFWSTACWPNKNSSLKYANLQGKTIINLKTYCYKKRKKKNDYQMAHLFINDFKKVPILQLFLCQHFMVFNFDFFSVTRDLTMFQTEDEIFRYLIKRKNRLRSEP